MSGPLKTSILTRFTIVNELLRRCKHPEHDDLNLPQDSTSANAEDGTNTSSHNNSLPSTKLDTITQSEVTPLGESAGCGSEILDCIVDSNHRTCASTSQGELRQRQSRMWRPGLLPSRGSDAIYTSLQQTPKTRHRDSHTTQAVQDASQNTPDRGECLEASMGAQESLLTPQSQSKLRQLQDAPATDYLLPVGKSGGYCTHNFNVAEDRAYFASPASETTLCEDPSPAPRSHAVLQRHSSIDSVFDSTHTPTAPPRPKTNNGMLLLRTNASKEGSSAASARSTHHRKIYFKLPVKPSLDRLEALQHPDLGSWTLPRRTHCSEDELAAFPTPAERELEYKHRHTFIGTASLDDFLEILEISNTHTTTKLAVIRAFISLASSEQLYARRCSTQPTGWELVSRITAEVTSTDYVVQLQIKVGSITLRQFLDLVPFNERGEVGALPVVRAFSAASHIDSRAGVGTGSKARAFRSWMIAQEDEV